MSTDLSPTNEQFVQDAVASGAYESRGQLLDNAVELLKQRREEILSMIEAGAEQLARGERIPAEEVLAELEAEAEAIEREALGDR